MLNKEVLEVTAQAYADAWRRDIGTYVKQDVPVWAEMNHAQRDAMRRCTRAAIEAYLAALPDEGEVVAKLRQRCSEIKEIIARDGSISTVKELEILSDIANALEVAQAKVANLSGPLEAEGTWTPKAIQAAAPKGWRLVPEEKTDEMYEAGAKALHVAIQDLDHDETGAGDVFDAMLAAAPEPPGKLDG